jgi:hypothetical protein
MVARKSRSEQVQLITAILTHFYSGGSDLAFLFPLPSVYTLSLLWCLNTTTRVRQEHTRRDPIIGSSFSHLSQPAQPTHLNPGFPGSTISSPLSSENDVEKGMAGMTKLGFITGEDVVLSPSSDATGDDDGFEAESRSGRTHVRTQSMPTISRNGRMRASVSDAEYHDFLRTR